MNREHLTVVTANIEHDGSDDPQRWTAAMEILRDLKPDVLLRQEMSRSVADGHRRLLAAEDFLGMRGFMSGAPAESFNPTGVFLNPSLFTPTGHYRQETNAWLPVTNVSARLAGTERDLILASWHLCYYDADTRASEARRAVNYTRHGRIAIAGGDCNSYPEPGPGEPPLPNWDEVVDDAHYVHRTIWTPDGNWIDDYRVDQLLRAGGYRDAARVAYDSGRTEALTPTSNLWRTDEGARRRIDRIYLSKALVNAVDDVRVLSDKEMRGTSDHAFVVAELNLQTLRDIINSLPQ